MPLLARCSFWVTQQQNLLHAGDEQVWDNYRTFSDQEQTQLATEAESEDKCHRRYLASEGWPWLEED